ncbi:putative hydrolase of the HAD superfamily [Devosia lucknowensis]|uniref:Putative hydrolase of the HAD superfamily n=1 Tax=Devosia lucknowensis TaxID=1096929 RepID=A0A1Y6EYH4_9HYPH|nr:HAD family hydrolase [Devosia lucknowensis]SMQ66321.1 putative hydrolase of the HAD superfamily [Devosia lucknowensis]
MTRAVIFDVDGVLVHGYHARPHLRDQFDQHMRDFGMDPERFQAEFIVDIFLKKVLIGQTAMIEALDRRLPGLGYRGSPMTFAHFWLGHEGHLNHELVDAIRALRTHPDVRLFLATNQDHMRAQWLWQSVGLGDIFEDMFYSARIGMTKAHKGFFAFADDHIGKFDEPPLFFDDTPKVIEVARSAGWDAVLFEDNADVLDHPWIANRRT